MNDERPFLHDMMNKSADELVEMYSIIIRRAVNSTDTTFIPELNGTIKNTTLRLLELGFEINSVYDKFIKENNEKRKREIIEIYDNETKERVEECEKINNLLSSAKKKYRKTEYDAMNQRVKLFAYGADAYDKPSSSPARNTRSYSDPVHDNEQENTNSPQRSSSAGDGVYIKQEIKETQVKRGPGRPRKERP